MVETEDGRPFELWGYQCTHCGNRYHLIFPDPPPKRFLHRRDLRCRGHRGHDLFLLGKVVNGKVEG